LSILYNCVFLAPPCCLSFFSLFHHFAHGHDLHFPMPFVAEQYPYPATLSGMTSGSVFARPRPSLARSTQPPPATEETASLALSVTHLVSLVAQRCNHYNSCRLFLM
jgi:hypothetical protein